MSENGRHKACNSCRERKIKCDGGQPKCGRCTRCGVQCFYAPPSKRYSKADFASVLETLNNRLLQAEAVAATAQNSVRQSLPPSVSPSLSSMWASFAPISTPSESAFVGIDYMNGQNHFPAARDFALPDLSPTDIENGGDFMFPANDSGNRMNGSGLGNFSNSAMISPDLSPPTTSTKEFDFGVGAEGSYAQAKAHGLTNGNRPVQGRSLPSPGSSNATTTFPNRSGDHRRRESQAGQDHNNGNQTRPSSRELIDPALDFTSTDPKPRADLSGVATNFSPVSNSNTKNHLRTRQGLFENENGSVERSSETRSLPGEDNQNSSRSSKQASGALASTRTSTSYDYSPTYTNDDQPETQDNFEYGTQFTASNSHHIPTKRRRLQMDTSEQYPSESVNNVRMTREFELDQEVIRASTSSQYRSGSQTNGTGQRPQSRRESSSRSRVERRSSGESYLPSPKLSKPPTPCSSAMRRSIGTGTAFNGLVKLRGRENYPEWARAIRAAARKEGVWDIMTGTCGPPKPINPNASICDQQEYQDDIVYWTNKTELALGGLEGSLEDQIQASVDNIECPRTMWLTLEREYKPGESKDLYNLIQRLDNISLMGCGNVERLATELRQIQDRVEYLKKSESLPSWYFAFRFLHSLGSAYEDFTTKVLLEVHRDQEQDISFEQIVTQAIVEERRHR